MDRKGNRLSCTFLSTVYINLTHMITMLMMRAVIRAARESGEVTEEELNNLVFSLVKWMLIIFLVIGVFWVFTDPQFCFRREIIGIINTVKNLDI